jgi:NAD(P)-dependent dehydrogenase (short-subunit alcohol dehydrogenase family)
MKLAGEVVLITGGSSGIGLATAQRFAREGARVVLAARTSERLQAAATAVGHGARVVAADMTDLSAVRALAADLSAREGRLDVLINCAGQLQVGLSEKSGPEVAEALIRVNYLGAVYTIDACMDLLRAGTRRSIVNLSSVAGKVAPPSMGAYAASKFALAAYTHVLRQELRPQGFHVALISPGPVDTPMIQDRYLSPDYPRLPGLRVVSPATVAEAVLRAVTRRKNDVVVPGYLGALLPIGQAFPGMIDLIYRLARR